jgi:hypothetical protein
VANNSHLPAPEQLILKPLTELELAELIEQYVEFFDDYDRTVRLPSIFVKAFLQRDDGEKGLPIVSSIAQLPIVLPDGTILTGQGLNAKYGILFRVPKDLDALIPSLDQCTEDRVAKAMRLLTDEWLADVATDYSGKCTIIAANMMILERALLPERPVIFVTAGHPKCGKTTTLKMTAMATTGRPAAAAAWSNDPEERRKALFSHLDLNLEYLIWDNIQKGAAISCPSIEKACTVEHYTDRILGASTTKTVQTYTILFFTGNNIGPRGDLASRALMVRLNVDRTDPENRSFSHLDPVQWTSNHRGEILAALYTLLLGNPRRRQKPSVRAPEPTRFKVWWDMIGSAVEFAAAQHLALLESEGPADAPEPRPTAVDFNSIFRDAETDEEENTSLASVLDVLRSNWPNGTLFQASDVINRFFPSFAGDWDSKAVSFKAALELACGKPIPILSAPAINWKLQAIKDAPVVVEDKPLILRYSKPDRAGRDGGFKVEGLITPDAG